MLVFYLGLRRIRPVKAPQRITVSTQLVLEALLADPGSERYGAEIGQLADLASGTVHPILARLEGYGWLESRWEDLDPRSAGRPARRYYRLTSDGAASARRLLAPRRSRLAGLRPLAEQ